MNIFDTKIASKVVRTYTDQHGLKNLVYELSENKGTYTFKSSKVA